MADIKTIVAVTMLVIRVIYALGIAVRNNTGLEVQYIEKDITDTLTELDKPVRRSK